MHYRFRHNLICRQSHGVSISNAGGLAYTINIEEGGGVIFNIPLNVKSIMFKYEGAPKFCQFGICNENGTLPSIILTGENRVSFRNINFNNNGSDAEGYYIQDVTAADRGYGFFIGGIKDVVISDIQINEFII